MTVHIVKLCVGCDSIDDLAAWQKERVRQLKQDGARPELFHRTFQTPKRRDDVLDGGSLYWVIKGLILVRQAIFDLREGTKDDGSPCCRIMLRRSLVPVRPTPRRAFQGWRYLDAADAPPDVADGVGSGADAMPIDMRRQLAELCLI